MFTKNDLLDQMYRVPIAVFGGIGFGLVWGFISRYIPEKKDVSKREKKLTEKKTTLPKLI